MGQASQRKKLYQKAMEHLKQFGIDQDLPNPDSGASAQWLHQFFVRTLPEAANEGATAWQNQVYLNAQCHADPNIRRGIRCLMNDVLTCGLEPGRVVFALLTQADLVQPELIGEFDTCESLTAWVATQLGVPQHNVRVRYSRMFVPARAGLFGLTPTLEVITQKKPLGEKPGVTSHQGTREEQRCQRLMFLVSVFTSKGVDLSKLTPVAPAPTFQLPYWGPKDITPDQVATITPLEAMQAFDALLMLGFWESLQKAETVLAPYKFAAHGASLSELPTVLVSEHESHDPRYPNGTELCVRWRDIEMEATPVYRGGFAKDFIWQLERLGVRIERTPGLQPALPVPESIAPDSEWTTLADQEPGND